MDKLKMHTPDFTDENIARIAELFPSCVTESRDDKGNLTKAIDFDLLKQELSGNIVEGPQERYHLDWPGKRQALLNANAPIAKTLRPSRTESVDFDTTKNLYIEGDNLDALKLLQETYLGKVKMIYIDPPYNTGNDFIYEDDFAEDKDTYFERSMQKDEEGNRLVANAESNGRFHSDWLSMLYPRLRLSRNLLTDNGVVFISIDDNEVANLLKACNEVFGEQNFLAQIVWQKIHSAKNDARYFSNSHEYIICFAKNLDSTVIKLLPRTAEMDARFTNPDNDARGPWASGDLVANGERSTGYFDIEGPTGKVFNVVKGKHWVYSEENLRRMITEGRIWFGASGDAFPRLKRYLSEVQQGRKADTLWLSGDVGNNQESARELKRIFDDVVVFDTPKPVRLVSRCLAVATEPGDVVLDFFAGASTTAHAVMAVNAEDGGNRRYILVQLPEDTNEDREAFNAGYKTIAEIGKERIRRAGKKIKEEAGLRGANLDIGFRVLKVDTSNMKDVYYSPDTADQQSLLDQVTNIKEDRTPEDLLFQVLLDWGVDLTLPITKETIAGKTTFFVDTNALAACFDERITEDLINELAGRDLLRMVFRDSGFATDDLKINAEQIFKLKSPGTEVRSI